MEPPGAYLPNTGLDSKDRVVTLIDFEEILFRPFGFIAHIY
jgi:hypothetical protein